MSTNYWLVEETNGDSVHQFLSSKEVKTYKRGSYRDKHGSYKISSKPIARSAIKLEMLLLAIESQIENSNRSDMFKVFDGTKEVLAKHVNEQQLKEIFFELIDRGVFPI